MIPEEWSQMQEEMGSKEIAKHVGKSKQIWATQNN